MCALRQPLMRPPRANCRIRDRDPCQPS
jgi:hypothetical protein